MITTRCSLGCRHCVYANVNKEDMSRETIEKSMILIKKLKIKRLLVTGGEPFQVYDNLIFTLEKSFEFLPPSKIFLITSASWAKNYEIVKKNFDPVIKLGLKNLSISIDAFHLENINPNNYFFILDYLKNTDIIPVILIRYTRDIYKNIFLLEKIKKEYRVRFLTDIIVPTGGAGSLPKEEILADKIELNKFKLKYDSNRNYYSKLTIKDILKSFVRSSCVYPTFFPNGDIHICCRKNNNTFVCNILQNDFNESIELFNKKCFKNIKCVILKELDCEECQLYK